MPTDNHLAFLKRVLTPKRLEHSLGVMQVMGDFAEIYGLDKEKAQAIGVLHDAAKDLPPELQSQLVAEGQIEIRHECEKNYLFYLHGPVSSYFVKKELGITDGLTLDAITMHTYCGEGENLTHPIVWCLRFSDFLEPTRNWVKPAWLHGEVERLRKIAYAGQLQEAAWQTIRMDVQWFDEAGWPVHPNMRRLYNELLAQAGGNITRL